MGLAIGVFLIALGALITGVCVGRLTAPDRQIRKADLSAARKTISGMTDIALRYYSQSDIVGRAMIEELQEEAVNYWRGIKL